MPTISFRNIALFKIEMRILGENGQGGKYLMSCSGQEITLL